MHRVGFTKIAMWQTSNKQLCRKRPEYQEENSIVKCDCKAKNVITVWAQR